MLALGVKTTTYIGKNKSPIIIIYNIIAKLYLIFKYCIGLAVSTLEHSLLMITPSIRDAKTLSKWYEEILILSFNKILQLPRLNLIKIFFSLLNTLG